MDRPLVPEDADMGELLDALNTLDAGGAAPEEPKSTVDQAAKAFQSASRRVGEAVDAARQPDMPLDVLTKWFGRFRSSRSPLRLFLV